MKHYKYKSSLLSAWLALCYAHVSTPTAWAAGDTEAPCPCLELPGLSEAIEGASLASDLNDRFATMDGRAFYRSKAQIGAYKLRLDAAKVGRKICPQSPPAENGKFVMRLNPIDLFRPRPYHTDETRLLNLPQEFRDRFKNNPDGFVQYVQGNSIETISNDFQAPSRTYAIGIAVALKALYRPDGQTLTQALAPYRGKLNMREIVAVAQSVGGSALNVYDTNKANTLKRTPLPADQVLRATREYQLAALSGNPGPMTAGVCGDVGNAQGAVMEALGARNVYLVGYTNSEAMHFTVIAQAPAWEVKANPSLRDTYFKANYGYNSTAALADGGQLLHVTFPTNPHYTAIGPDFNISRVDGRTVGHVPSEIGKAYAEIAGFDVRNIEPFARTSSSLIGTQLDFSGGRSGQIFTGRDATGEIYGGISMNQAYLQDTHFPGKVGVVTAVREFPTERFTVGDLYVQLEQQAKTSDIKIAREISARIDASLNVIGAIGASTSPKATWQAFGGTVLVNTGAQVTAGDPSGPASARLRAQSELAPGVTNPGALKPMMYLNHLMFSSEGRFKLGQTPAGRAYLTVATIVLLDYFGPRVMGQLGIETPKVGARFEVVGKVLDDTPDFKDGSLRRERAVAGYSINDFLRISFMGEVVSEKGGGPASLMGGLDGKF